VGYRFGDDIRMGWEASGGFGVLRGSMGQAFNLGDGSDTDIYLAGEPGVVAGATFGGDYDSSGSWGFMPGGWVGVPFYQFPGYPAPSYSIGNMDPYGTIAIGYRYAHGHELYLAPKLYYIQHVGWGH
jgi:hypothetical protein